MTDRIRISRRRVMQMGIAAPLIAMEARGASDKEVAAAAAQLAKIPIPTPKLDDFKTRAEAYCTNNACEGFEKDKYGEIANVLWAYFCAGVEYAGAKVPERDPALSALLEAAYTAQSDSGKSGELIASRLKEWGDVYEHVTNYCAFSCGIYAAEIAKAGKEVTAPNYLVAFGKTSAGMKGLVKRINSNGGRARILGGGC
jgi:hypothetical protein